MSSKRSAPPAPPTGAVTGVQSAKRARSSGAPPPTAIALRGIYTPPKRRAAPKRKSGKKQLTKLQKLHMMNPFGAFYPPPSNSLGNFLCLNDLGRGTLASHTTQNILAMFIPSVGGVYTFVAYYADGTFVSGSELTSPTYKYRTGECPVVIKPFRAGIKMVNTSASDDIAGSVQVLNNSSPIKLTYSGTGINLSATCMLSLVSLVQDSHKTKTFSAHELKSSHLWLNFPATRSDYEKYRAFNQNIDAAEYTQQFAAAETDMPMSTLMFLFSTSPTSNNYAIETCIQHASRFNSNLLQNLQKPATSSTAAQDAQMHDVHSTLASNGAGAIMTPM